ncbi:TIR domain-containing protein [bacterium]|nr:MAG: TIR domain-containing protein [bacterium]
MTENPKVFISYAWESPEHQDRVLALADWFEMHGVEVIFDQYDPNPVLPWPKWMEKALRDATFVVSVCTKTYCMRVTEQQPPGEGLGAQWEGTLIYNALNQQPEERSKFQVVQFDAEDRSSIPAGLAGNNRYVIKDLSLEDPRLEDLYRLITNQPRAKRPKRGDIVKLPSVERTVVPRSGITNFEPFVAELSKVESNSRVPTHHPGRRLPEISKGIGKGTYPEKLARANAERAYEAERADDIDATLFYAQKALRLDSQNLVALRLAANSLYRLGQFEQSLPLLEAFTSRRPDDALEFFRLLRVRDLVKGTNNLQSEGRRKIDLVPNRVEAIIGYASVCSDHKAHEEAVGILEAEVPRNDSFELRTSLAVNYWFAGESGKATAILEDLPKEKFSAVDWTNLGVGRAEMGRFGMAIEAINEGLRLGGRGKFAQYALAEIYALMGEKDAAIQKLETLKDGGWHYLTRAKTDRTFDPIRPTREFQAFIASIS